MATTAIVPNEDYSVDHDPALKGFRLKGDVINPGADMVYGTDSSGVKGWQSAASGGSSFSRDSLSSGAVTSESDRYGGAASILTNPAAGEYKLSAQGLEHVSVITLYGNNSTLNANQEFVFKFDNSVNSIDRRFMVQLYDANNGALVDQQITGTVHSQTVAGNVTTITLPGMNGFGSAGFYIELR